MRRRSSILLLIVLATLPCGTATAGGIGYTNCSHCSPPPPPGYVTPLRAQLPGIVRVDQQFSNGDHRIRRIATYPLRPYWGSFLDPALVFDFRDQNLDDPFGGHVTWYNLNQHTMRTTAGTCAGTCRLPIPALPSGDTIGLVGWDLQTADGGDMDVRELSIIPSPQAGYIDVTLADDSRTRPINVIVYYVRLVALEIVQLRTRNSATPARDVVQMSRPEGDAVLRGFRLRFTDSAHFLEHWAVELCLPPGDGRGCVPDMIRLRFTDLGHDKPFDWWIAYAMLGPEMY